MLNGENKTFNKEMGYTIKTANVTLFLLAYTLGKTSPKSNNKKEMVITSTANESDWNFKKENELWKK